MRVLVWGLTALAAVSTATVSLAAVSCPDRAPAPITAAGALGLECQKAIAKEGGKFVKAKTKVLTKCRIKAGAPAVCPSAKDTMKLQKAANKAAAKIATACGGDAAQGALASSYNTLTDEAVIGSCLLSQHNVVGQKLADTATGISTESFPSGNESARATCVNALAKIGPTYATKALQAVSKCLNAQSALGTAGDLAPVCAGQYSGGTFVPPTDAKAAKALTKLAEKVGTQVAKFCPDGDYIPTLFACAGSTSSADLETCLTCTGWDGVLDLVEQQYAERGTYVAHGPGALQIAVAAGTTDTKLLIGPGTYEEEITIPAHGMELVGCGGANNNRPKVEPPSTPGPHINGIFASGKNRLLFQSLEANDWDENGIFVTQADGVTFRDVISDGKLNSTYGVFPILSNDVLIEQCDVRGVIDAGIYVGQSTNITVRHNLVIGNVAGLEIENSGNANVHNNYATDNSGGILVFKLPGLPTQISNCHEVHHNISEKNDAPNIGHGTVGLVPPGTGMIALSNNGTVFHHNIARNNGSFGIAVTDQVILDALFSAFGGVYSPDFTVKHNSYVDNVFTGNGGNPDPSVVGFNYDVVHVISPSVGNCQRGNTLGSDLAFLTLPVCADPLPAAPGCPEPPIL